MRWSGPSSFRLWTWPAATIKLPCIPMTSTRRPSWRRWGCSSTPECRWVCHQRQRPSNASCSPRCPTSSSSSCWCTWTICWCIPRRLTSTLPTWTVFCSASSTLVWSWRWTSASFYDARSTTWGTPSPLRASAARPGRWKLWRTGRCRRPLLLCAAFWASPATTDVSSRASRRLLVPSMTWSLRATHVTRRKGPTSPSCGTSSTRRRSKSWRQPWLQLLSWGLQSLPSPSSSRQTPAMTGWVPSSLKIKMGRDGSWPTQVDGCVPQRRTRPTTPAWSWNSWPLNGQSQRSFVTTSWTPSSMSSQTTTPWSISELPRWVPLSKDGLPNSPSFTSRWSIGQGSPTLLMPFPECPLISTPKFPLHPCHPKSQWRRSWPVSISPLPQRRLSPACLQTPQPSHQRVAHQSHPVCLQPDSVNASWATSPLVQSSHRVACQTKATKQTTTRPTPTTSSSLLERWGAVSPSAGLTAWHCGTARPSKYSEAWCPRIAPRQHGPPRTGPHHWTPAGSSLLARHVRRGAELHPRLSEVYHGAEARNQHHLWSPHRLTSSGGPRHRLYEVRPGQRRQRKRPCHDGRFHQVHAGRTHQEPRSRHRRQSPGPWMVSALRCSGTDPQRPGTRLRVPSGERAVRHLRHQEDQNDAVPPTGKRPVRAFQPLHARSAAYAASGAEAPVARPSAGAGPGVQQHASRLDRLRTLLPALRTGAPTAGGRPAGTSSSHCSRGSRLGSATPPPPAGGPPQGIRPAEASCSQEGPLRWQGSRWPCTPGGRPRLPTQPRAGPPQNPGLLAARAA